MKSCFEANSKCSNCAKRLILVACSVQWNMLKTVSTREERRGGTYDVFSAGRTACSVHDASRTQAPSPRPVYVATGLGSPG